MRLSNLQNKDVVNVKDGSKIGNIIDVEITVDGRMNNLVVEKSKFILSRFSTKGEIEIKWEQIEKIGEDVILVNINV
ncbi:MAG: YlmC/YmxH family sporulation protein [Clostridium sp.]|nr:YlmC/YmxH family sporulation protein [Clostridium sp.]MCM1444697.1 YlmC/YmxH family sporulation protein [Candidatus Amulumruptor caecigallinarius]